MTGHNIVKSLLVLHIAVYVQNKKNALQITKYPLVLHLKTLVRAIGQVEIRAIGQVEIRAIRQGEIRAIGQVEIRAIGPVECSCSD